MKKILGLVMVIVLALCLGGCDKNVPKADYYFSVQDFVMDCTFAYDKSPYHSMVKAAKIYENKRIEFSGKILMKIEKNDIFTVIFSIPNETDLWSLEISVRDKNILDKLKEGDFVKMSGLFDKIRIDNDENTDEIHFAFIFIDGVLISKL